MGVLYNLIDLNTGTVVKTIETHIYDNGITPKRDQIQFKTYNLDESVVDNYMVLWVTGPDQTNYQINKI